ncbi:F-box domain-containing protein [Mycena kentingensis (nom. inval.)]|nr:F-box domain-containing protein [Mycena kentingensis (nom. inval.)]
MVGAETSPASVLRAQLASIDRERASVHAQIAALHEKLEQLAKTRTTVTTQLKAVTFPILTLPNEITSEIFANYSLFIAHECGSLHSAPTVLTHVCRAWRQLALSLPKIWTQIFMGSESSPSIDFLLRLWFDRAGSQPLHVTTPDEDEGDAQRLFSMLVAYSDQFESLDCAFPLPEGCSLQPISGRVSNLRELSLYVNPQPSYPINVFATAPSLRKLVLSLYHENVVTAQIKLPWAQLTELRADYGFAPDLLQTIQKIPQLEVLELRAASYTPPAAPIQLTRLHTLRLHSAGGPVGTLQCLTYLVCPSLHNLELGVFGQYSAPTFSSFIKRADCIRCLTLSQLTSYEMELVLSRMPGIEDLSVLRVQDPYSLISSLRIQTPQWRLVPNLQKLHIELSGTPALLPEISAMLKTRVFATSSPAMSTLRQLTISTMESPDTSLSVAQLGKQLCTEVGPRGCKVDIAIQRTKRLDSRVGWAPGRNLLYSLDDVDDDT